jgi:glycosyltransferase involved in cell wall biosynthesis
VTVVDDGSSDGTAAAAQRAGAHVLHHATNRGKGHALVTGMAWARGREIESLLTLDGDGQHSPRDIPALLAQAGEGADLVIGRRRLRLGAIPFASFVGNSVSTFYLSLFLLRAVPDGQCGLRLYSRRLLETIPIRGGRFETETEILMRASRLGMDIRWVPIETIYPHGPRHRHTHFRSFSDSLLVIRTALHSLTYPRRRS